MKRTSSRSVSAQAPSHREPVVLPSGRKAPCCSKCGRRTLNHPQGHCPEPNEVISASLDSIQLGVESITSELSATHLTPPSSTPNRGVQPTKPLRPPTNRTARSLSESLSRSSRSIAVDRDQGSSTSHNAVQDEFSTTPLCDVLGRLKAQSGHAPITVLRFEVKEVPAVQAAAQQAGLYTFQLSNREGSSTWIYLGEDEQMLTELSQVMTDTRGGLTSAGMATGAVLGMAGTIVGLALS